LVLWRLTFSKLIVQIALQFMWNGFIGKRIAATTKNLRRWSIALFIAAVSISLLGARTFLNVMRGPAELDESQLAALPDPTFALRNYATVHGTKTVSTEIEEIEKTTRNGAVESKRTTGEYMAMIVGSRILIVKTMPGAKAEKYTGTIVLLPDDLKKELFANIADSKLQAATLPLMLDASEDYADGLMPGGVMVGILLLISLWTYIKSKTRSEHPETHPLCKALSQYGPLYTIVPEIDEEARTAASTLGGVTFTVNWMIVCSLTKTVAMRRQEIVWVYKKRTKHSVNFIPVGTTNSLALRDSRGKLLQIYGSEQYIDNCLSSLVKETPWIIVGYDRKLEKLYKKQRPAFVEAVATRHSGSGNPPN
jgi:hypothetical protein